MKQKLSLEEGKLLVKTARKAIKKYLGEEKKISAPECSEKLRQKRGVFCTLNTYPEDVLRGCIGLPYPKKPLVDGVIEAAVSSTRDPRFKDLQKEELNDIVIELSVLTKPKKLDEPYPEKIDLGTHGLIIKKGGRSGLLLPQVPEQAGWSTAEKFLNQTCWKAGLNMNCWKEGAEVYRFRAQIFKEKEPSRKIVEE